MKRSAVFSALLLATLLIGTSSASADGQWSSRLGIGGGVLTDRAASAREGVFELHIAGDLLFGGARPNVIRIGPLVDLRTGDFVTAEASGGVSLSLPVIASFPLTISGGLGYASRRGDLDNAFVLSRVTFGYHAYNYLSPYAYALDLYVDGRVDLARDGLWQVMAGVEIDLEFVIAIPVMFVAKWLTGSDPDEPST